MIRLIAEAWLGLRGVARLLTFKPEWEQDIDLSLRGFWHSFAASLLALPLIGIIIAGLLFAEISDFLTQYAVSYWLSWLLFPIASGLTVAMLGVRQSFAAWVILHNWGVVFLYGLQAAFWILFIAGLADQSAAGLFFYIYGPIRILVHWRIAYVALGLPTLTSALAAAVPVLAGEFLYALVDRAFAAPIAG
jgi:hypothetical protein